MGYTLYGVVVEVWVLDLQDSAFEGVHGLPGAEAKHKLVEMFAKQGVDAKVTLTFVVVSSDLHHDPAFV
jgi:hypothetical protein